MLSRRHSTGRVLLRAGGTLASTMHAKATTATLRAQLINVAARVASSARRSTRTHRLAMAEPWKQLFAAAFGPPATA